MLRVVTAGGAALALTLATAPGVHAAPRGHAAHRARAAAAGPYARLVRGLDISAYQHGRTPINWRLLARDGIRFVSVKVSEGTYYRNPYYQSDVRAAAAAGLAVLPYVFANPARAGGAPTARFAVRVTGSLRGPGRLPLVVDLENDPYRAGANCYGLRGGKAAMIRWIAGFVRQARALTGKWPVIYTGPDWWRECAGGTSQFHRDPLWLASYEVARPAVPGTWGHWTFWQYNNVGRLRGIGTADLDYYQPTGELPALRPLPRRVARSRSLQARPSRVRHLVRRQRRP
jgi:GH25 family lysozyme M1 (1,4-beta-N-acetylmuramidase)